MKFVTADEMRALDRRTIDDAGLPGDELMRAAGEGLADAVRRLADSHRLVESPVLFAAGCGNNGGDAFVAALTLHEAGWPVECWIAGTESRLKGDALTWFRRMKKSGVAYREMAQPADWIHAAECGTDAEIVVDGLLGTGASGEPRGVVADAIRFVDAQADRALVVAVDAPSAMAVRADLTVAMGLPKIDCADPAYIDQVGCLEVVDIGIPPAFIGESADPSAPELIHPSDLTPLFPRRPRDAHKGVYGHLLCIGGSRGFSGAIMMAARAAARSGAGLVSALVPESVCMPVASAVPEVMVHAAMPEARWTALLAGPGMGRSDQTRVEILRLLETAAVPLVLDADALTVLAGHTDAIRAAKGPVILTPHPGEFAALLDLKPEEVQEDRQGLARMAADRLGATVVLKGAGTLVAAPGMPLAVNLTGNPGMATGGSGDVLAGLLAGLIAQGIAPFGAACAAVWLHGRAGDLAAAEKSQAALTAPDLIDRLPDAFRELSCR